MKNIHSWGIGTDLEYAKKYLEEGRYPICKPTRDYFLPRTNRLMINSASVAGMDMDVLENLIVKGLTQIAYDAVQWAAENHPWENQSGDACRALSAMVDDNVILSGIKAGKGK